MKKECKLIQDLLPNYIENLTSGETNQIIEEHLKDCEECQNVLSTMKEKITTNTENIEKKKVNYLKKYNREVRVLQIIVLIILIGFIANVGRKYIIIESLHQKFSETTENLDNYHYKKESYSMTMGEKGVMSTEETYYKDGNFVTIHCYTQDKKIRESIFYRKNNDIQTFLRKMEDGEVTIGNIIYTGEIEEYAIKPGWHFEDSFFKNLYVALFMNIEKVELEGKSCYAIEKNGSTFYIDANTGIKIKSIHTENTLIVNDEFETGNVKDSDIVIPNSLL